MEWGALKEEIYSSVLSGIELLKKNADSSQYKRIIKTYSDTGPKREIDKLIFDNFSDLIGNGSVWLVGEDYQESEMPNEEYFAIIDPVDGTSNYSRNIPFYTIGVGIGKNKNKSIPTLNDIEYSIVASVEGQLFEAEKGKGATLNGVHLTVAMTKELREAIIRPSSLFNSNDPLMKSQFSGHIYLGSTSLELMYLASGKIDAFIETKNRKIPDFAPAYLIVNEAGGIISNLQGFSIAGLPILTSSKSTLIISCKEEIQKSLIHIYDGYCE
jgi:myo-inositol-1(or 4)-monophosphatase